MSTKGMESARICWCSVEVKVYRVGPWAAINNRPDDIGDGSFLAVFLWVEPSFSFLLFPIQTLLLDEGPDTDDHAHGSR